MNDCILELRDASFSYDRKVSAIEAVNVKINKGERIAVLGENGSGKSTFFWCLNGIHVLSKGRIRLNGRELPNNRKAGKCLSRAVGYVFQEPDSQIIGATVAGEISFGLINSNTGQEEIQSRMDAVLKKFDLTDKRECPPHHLSGGEKKRVTIADILVLRPQVLLLDEPTAALDLKHKEAFEQQLQEQEMKSLAILISTHEVDFAWRWAERILVFHRGRIISDTSPEKTFENEQLIAFAGLRKPVYYSITEKLCTEFHLPMPAQIPKDEVDFQEFIKKIKIYQHDKNLSF